jgi:hypothetical protein
MNSIGEFYRVMDDVHHPDRWHLGVPLNASGREADPWQFMDGKSLRAEPGLRVPVRYVGEPLDLTFAAFDVPVVSRRAQTVLMSVAADDIQLIPVIVDDVDESGRDYAVLNAVRSIQCLDESSSEFLKWTTADRRPDRLGSYRMVTKLRIESREISANVFRVAGWEVALIASSAVRDAILTASLTGIKFEPV